MGCSQASVVSCASATSVAGPCPRWHIVQPQSRALCGIGGCARNGCGTELSARLACVDALMASRAAIHNVHSRQPDLIDIRIVVRQQVSSCRVALARICTNDRLYFFHSDRKSFTGEIARTKTQRHCGHRKRQPHAVRQFAHLFSRHASPKATPRTSPGLEKMSPQRSSKAPWR